MEKIVSLCKRRGFVFPDSEIYGGLAGTWSYGHLGSELLNNIKELWWHKFVSSREDIIGVRTPIIMNPRVWETVGHVSNFNDLFEGELFNTMFKTNVGAQKNEATIAYLRPETAQGMFANFNNLTEPARLKIPFGMAQIGKAFRNEISPRDFLFRAREFEQMEIEYFVRESEWEKWFEYWRNEMWTWFDAVGINKSKVNELEVPERQRAHYSKRTIDFEFDWPFGRKELYGLAYRTDFDLRSHMEKSGVDLRYEDPETGEKFIPHVVEPTFGVDRTFLAILLSAYREDEMGGEPRVYLALKPSLAPVKVAVFPLLKNKPELVIKAREVYKLLQHPASGIQSLVFDDNGNIGKRYRRQDEIGTPFCVTIDFETLENDTVTLRDRDSGNQVHIDIAKLSNEIKKNL